MWRKSKDFSLGRYMENTAVLGQKAHFKFPSGIPHSLLGAVLWQKSTTWHSQDEEGLKPFKEPGVFNPILKEKSL